MADDDDTTQADPPEQPQPEKPAPVETKPPPADTTIQREIDLTDESPAVFVVEIDSDVES